MNPQYPIYIVSKGRWDSRLTSKALESIKVPYHIVIIKRKWRRWQHSVDYSRFKNNKPILRKDILLENKVNNYGMKVIMV